MGDFTEKLMDNFFEGRGKWTKVSSQVGRTGIDGLYTRTMKNGRLKILVVEAKYNNSQLGQGAKKGAQGSEKWIKNSIEERIEHLKRRLDKLDGDQVSKSKIKKEIDQLKVMKKGPFEKRVFSAKLNNPLDN